MKLLVEHHPFPLKTPFTITGRTVNTADAIWVTLQSQGVVGRGEAMGMYYLGESADSLIAQLQSIAHKLSDNIENEQIQSLLPPGGARNALDSAWWDLQAKKKAKTIWQLLGISPKPLSSVATISIDTASAMAHIAKHAYAKYPTLKIKLSQDDPLTRLEAVRLARPDARLVIDVNQGWSFAELQGYLPELKKIGIAMVEQPLPRGGDEELEGFNSPILLGADESCVSLGEYQVAARRYDVINIKLDKCGGLTEGLKIVEQARRDGKKLMIGNMLGSSLAMAPSYVIGQFCDFVDIDGPLFIKHDIDHALEYGQGGVVSVPTPELWG